MLRIISQNKYGVQFKLTQFRESLYTKETINDMLELSEDKQKTS